MMNDEWLSSMQGGLVLPLPLSITTWSGYFFSNVAMSHNQHQTHQPTKVWPKKTMFFLLQRRWVGSKSFGEVTSYPSRFQNTPPPEPKKKAKRGRNAFQDTQCFSIPENQTSWKKGWSTLVVFFFVLYTWPKKTPKKDMPTKMVLPYSCFLGFLVKHFGPPGWRGSAKEKWWHVPAPRYGRSQRWKKILGNNDPRPVRFFDKSSREDRRWFGLPTT